MLHDGCSWDATYECNHTKNSYIMRPGAAVPAHHDCDAAETSWVAAASHLENSIISLDCAVFAPDAAQQYLSIPSFYAKSTPGS